MNCPACRQPMVVLELEQVEIDHCIACGGIWLDAGELELLLEDAKKKDELLASLKVDKKTKEKPWRCPICSKKMEKVLCGMAREKVLIDKCKMDDGIWFDRDELKEVIRIGGLDGENRILGLLKDIFRE